MKGGPGSPSSPDVARYYDFGAGRVPGFMQKLTKDRPAILG